VTTPPAASVERPLALPGRGLVALGGLAFLGLLAVALLIGFGTVGFGIANVIPVLFSGAANVRGAGTGSALAAVATTGYFGFLAGPAVIGFTAELTSLPIGLALVSAACVVIAFRGGLVQAPVQLR